jgi:hypothetical protein
VSYGKKLILKYTTTVVGLNFASLEQDGNITARAEGPFRMLNSITWAKAIIQVHRLLVRALSPVS